MVGSSATSTDRSRFPMLVSEYGGPRSPPRWWRRPGSPPHRWRRSISFTNTEKIHVSSLLGWYGVVVLRGGSGEDDGGVVLVVTDSGFGVVWWIVRLKSPPFEEHRLLQVCLIHSLPLRLHDGAALASFAFFRRRMRRRLIGCKSLLLFSMSCLHWKM
ncbi:hypothetical protein Ddye_001911 [Dipteronia dyeriana]|uniref:Uncharacterized protein n=1 Tax=Dipteronia dyeriana TaxID=168575 RepID=A0AAD9XPY9_9ROSI|nr:hypothetical protein Ddye_001911 [Dipteronia dyeriana]